MLRVSPLFILFAIAVPLALVLGYLVATPDLASYAVVLLVLFVLTLPILLQIHHLLLILFWNSAFDVFFLPGQPHIWLVLAALSFSISMLNFVMGRQRFMSAPEIAKPLFFLTVIILLTAKFRGGLGIRAFGGESYGGKSYVYVLGAIMGYFALTGQSLSLAKSQKAVGFFFLSATSFIISNIAYILGPAFYFLYYVLPTDYVSSQVMSDFGEDVVKRYAGLGPASVALLCFVLARWGIRGLFVFNRPWRLLLFFVAIAAATYSGFRSVAAMLFVLFIIQFMVEGLWRTIWLPVVISLTLASIVPTVLFANKMPASVQRVLSILPVDINPDVRQEAENSISWRSEMFYVVWQEVPQYFWIGKGYSIDPTEAFLTSEASRMGIISDYEGSIVTGDYHNGLLSILVPFGIFGLLGFLWLLGAGVKVLYCNYRYGDPKLQSINRLLFSYFVAESLLFFPVFGAFNSQLLAFVGILGLSVSLNGGVCRKPAAVRVAHQPVPLPAPLAVA